MTFCFWQSHCGQLRFLRLIIDASALQRARVATLTQLKIVRPRLPNADSLSFVLVAVHGFF